MEQKPIIQVIENSIMEYENSGRASKTGLARFILGNLALAGYEIKSESETLEPSQQKKTIDLDRAEKYARHQHYLGTQGKSFVPFDKWAYDPNLLPNH